MLEQNSLRTTALKFKYDIIAQSYTYILPLVAPQNKNPNSLAVHIRSVMIWALPTSLKAGYSLTTLFFHMIAIIKYL